MKRVERSEILDYATYEDGRENFRAEVIKIKAPRRVHLGDYFMLLFENHTTIRYQIQEMLRAERIVRETDILHEIETYNELLGKDGELGCTLLIEIEDPAIRNPKLQQWWSLPEKLYLRLEHGTLIRPTFDERQRGDGRLSSVQYMKFDTMGRVPIAAGVDLPDLQTETQLSGAQMEAMSTDLSASKRPTPES